MPVARINGAWSDPGASVAGDDPLVRAGDGLLETMRASGGRIAHRAAHLDRLAAGIDGLGWRGAPPMGAIEAELDAVLAALGGREAQIRLAISTAPTIWVEAREVAPLADAPDEVRAATVPGGWMPGWRTAEFKTSSRAHWAWAERVAAAAGADVALLTDVAGRLGESTRAAVFVVRGTDLSTAPVRGLLPGIGRRVVMELWPGVREIALAAEEWGQADEILLVSALHGVRSVVSVDGIPIGLGVAGPVARRLAAAYRRRVAAETTSASPV